MYLSKIAIRNFRVFGVHGIEVMFNKGVNAIIGENNCGKSALVDALRIAFSTVPYKKDIFFNKSDFHVNAKGEVAQTAQFDLYFEEVPKYLIEIWDPEHPTEGEFHIQFQTTKTPSGLDKIKSTAWGGKTEGNSLSTETFEAIEIAFLGALRDAESEMKPSRSSKLANLLSTIADSEERDDLVSLLMETNKHILQKRPIQRTKEIINSNLLDIEQDILRQRIDIGLVEPRFESIASSLRTWLKPRWCYIPAEAPIYATILEKCVLHGSSKLVQEDEKGIYLDINEFLSTIEDLDETEKNQLLVLSNRSFELYQNGLGYNNLLFMSAVLGDMAIEKNGICYNLFLIEEPEAHLHPQLQELVHNFFEKRYEESSTIQVIYTSHSPTLVSRIGVDKVNLLYERNHSSQCLPLSRTSMDDTDKAYLEKYLDVTKSQLFFAKGVLFVEGISEALLLPEMAHLLDRSLDKYAVEIVNINGVAFKPFAKLLTVAESASCFTKAAIITDDDRCTDKKDIDTYISKDLDYDDDISGVLERLQIGAPSDRFNNILELCKDTEIQMNGAFKTLEYELSLFGNNVALILQAIEAEFPQVGKQLKDKVNGSKTYEEKAVCIWLFIQTRNNSKGKVAQALCNLIQEQYKELKKGNVIDNVFTVPNYIKQAIYWVTEAQG